jgi:hypothetical protein
MATGEELGGPWRQQKFGAGKEERGREITLPRVNLTQKFRLKISVRELLSFLYLRNPSWSAQLGPQQNWMQVQKSKQETDRVVSIGLPWVSEALRSQTLIPPVRVCFLSSYQVSSLEFTIYKVVYLSSSREEKVLPTNSDHSQPIHHVIGSPSALIRSPDRGLTSSFEYTRAIGRLSLLVAHRILRFPSTLNLFVWKRSKIDEWAGMANFV